MDVKQDSSPEVNQESLSQVLHEDSLPEFKQQSLSDALQDSSFEIKHDSLEAKDDSLEVEHDSLEVKQDSPEFKQHSIPEVKQDSSFEVKEDSVPEDSQDSAPEVKQDSSLEDSSSANNVDEAPTDLTKHERCGDTKNEEEVGGAPSPWDGVLEPECNIEESNEEIVCPQPEYDPQQFVHHLTAPGYYDNLSTRKTRRTPSKPKAEKIHCRVPFPLYRNFEKMSNKEVLEMRSNLGIKSKSSSITEDTEPPRKKIRRSLRRTKPEEEGFAEIFNDPDSDCYMSDNEDVSENPECNNEGDTNVGDTLQPTAPSMYGLGEGWTVAGKEQAPQLSPQFTSSTGLKKDLAEKSILDIFLCVFTVDVMDLIIAETNRYHAQHPSHVTCSSHTESWTDLTRNDLLMFLTLLTLTGHHSTDKLKELWTKKYFLEYPFFRSCMPRDRFFSILSYLHFCDNNATPSSCKKDQAWKIRPLLDILLRQFKSLYDPPEHLVLDNVVVKFKGRVVFRRQVPKQKSQGILRLWKLVDSKSYTYDVLVCSEQDRSWNSDKDVLPHRLVTDLMSSLQNKGHVIMTDGDFTSPALFRELKAAGLHAVGVANPGCEGMPGTLSSNLQQGEIRYRRNNSLVAMAWKDKKENVVLSSLHGGQDDGFYQSKGAEPPCLQYYNKYTGHVEKGNKLIGSHSYVRKTWKWTKKVFFHLLDLSLVNCWVLYGLADGGSYMLSFRDFRLALIEQLLALLTSNAARPVTPVPVTDSTKPFNRLDGAQNRHWPELNEKRAVDSNQHRSKECIVCKSRRVRRKSTFHCGMCKANLCPYPCFKIYHTQIDYSLMENG